VTNPAEGYESCMAPPLFGPWAGLLIHAADPKAGERVLDVGCGTGVVARQVASPLGASGAVTAIDLSPQMLTVANAAAARDGGAVDCHVAGGTIAVP
jgi:ubiquinone/menaquinone biosynthesis C-methylase UbiE